MPSGRVYIYKLIIQKKCGYGNEFSGKIMQIDYGKLPNMSLRGSKATVAIYWYNLSDCCAESIMVPGDSHVGPLGLLGMTK